MTLADSGRSVMAVIDMQERLFPAVDGSSKADGDQVTSRAGANEAGTSETRTSETRTSAAGTSETGTSETGTSGTGAKGLIANVQALLRAASWLGIPVLVSEQYPQGLGTTLPSLAALLPAQTPIFEKRCFAASAAVDWYNRLESCGRSQVLLTGIEAHVCILQTAWDLSTRGWECVVVADAIASHHPEAARLALERMRGFGVTVSTSEMVLFEWLRGADHEHFKQISYLVKSIREKRQHVL